MQIQSDLGEILSRASSHGDAIVRNVSLRSRVEKEYEQRPVEDWWAKFASGGAFGSSGNGPRMDAMPHVLYDELIKLFRGSVFICAGAIAEKAASMKTNVFRQRMRKSGEYREKVSPYHPLVELLNCPHPQLTAFDMHYQNIGWLQICGDAYMHKQKNNFGIPVRLNPLSPQWVRVIPGELNFIDGYKINTQYLGSKNWDIPFSEMLRIKKPNLDWSSTKRFYGMSTLIAAENTIQLESEMLARLRHKFSNLANPGLIFKTKRRLNESQLKQNLDAIWTQHRLAEHEGKPMLVHDDMELISGADGKTQELDYRGSLGDTLRITSAAFGVPLAVVGLTDSQNKANAEAQLATFASNKLNPLLAMYSQCLTNFLAKDFDEDLIVELGPFTVRDYSEVVNGAQALWRAGAITPNEIRDYLLGLPPLDIGGDTPVLPAGVGLAGFGNTNGRGRLETDGDEEGGINTDSFFNYAMM